MFAIVFLRVVVTWCHRVFVCDLKCEPEPTFSALYSFYEYVRITLFFGNMMSWGSSWSRAEVSQIRAQANV